MTWWIGATSEIERVQTDLRWFIPPWKSWESLSCTEWKRQSVKICTGFEYIVLWLLFNIENLLVSLRSWGLLELQDRRTINVQGASLHLSHTLYQRLLDCKNNLPANTEISTCRAGNTIIHVPWQTLHSCPVCSHCLVPSVQLYAHPWEQKATWCCVSCLCMRIVLQSFLMLHILFASRKEEAVASLFFRFLPFSPFQDQQLSACCLKIPCAGAVCGA